MLLNASYRFLLVLTVAMPVVLNFAIPVVAEVKPASKPSSLLQKELDGRVVPLLKKHCYECHGDGSSEGGLALDQWNKVAQIATTGRKAWKKIGAKVHARLMPPQDAEELSAEDRKWLVEWVGSALDSVDCSTIDNPGRETIRRLNRAEYRNTIRDLTGVDLKVVAEFPADEVGYGFDNIGDVLTLPPLLLEKYLAAAESVSQQAIVTDPFEVLPGLRVEGAAMGVGSKPPQSGKGVARLNSNGEVYVYFDPPEDQEYLIRAHTYGEQAGPEPCKIEVFVDKDVLKQFDVKATGAEPGHYEVKIRLAKGKRRIGVRFINDYFQPEAENPSQRDRNLVVLGLDVLLPVEHLKLADYPERHRNIIFVAPSDTVSRDAAARQIVRRFAGRAFRRPATEQEVAALVQLVRKAHAEGDNFAQSIQRAVVAILVSPHFIYKVELDRPAKGSQTTRLLDDFELATRLSYFLWSSMPDQELFEEAQRGTLRKNLSAQVRRMLLDEKSWQLVNNFGLQWLQVPNLKDLAPNRRRFKDFDEGLRRAMREETRLTLGEIFRKNRSLLELIDADYTFVNARLAKHYGIRGSKSNKFERVAVRGTVRGGVITQASVLAITSNPTRTAPVKRGKWILETLLGEQPLPPPPDAPDLKESKKVDQSASLRVRLEQHRADSRCAVCHQQMDPLGFALENFDALGAWREKDGKHPIDNKGVLPGGVKFAGPTELKKVLLASRKDDFAYSTAEKLLTYALGRGVEYYDECALKKITKQLAEDDYKFFTLVQAIVHSEPFQRRQIGRSE